MITHAPTQSIWQSDIHFNLPLIGMTSEKFRLAIELIMIAPNIYALH